MSLLSRRLPRQLSNELKAIAAAGGCSGYQGLIRFYSSQGARKDLHGMDAPNLEYIARTLKENGVWKKVIAEALKAA